MRSRKINKNELNDLNSSVINLNASFLNRHLTNTREIKFDSKINKSKSTQKLKSEKKTLDLTSSIKRKEDNNISNKLLSKLTTNIKEGISNIEIVNKNTVKNVQKHKINFHLNKVDPDVKDYSQNFQYKYSTAFKFYLFFLLKI